MVESNERICCPPPAGELQRRWDSVRAYMREAKIDALVIQGAHSFSAGGGYFRWFTGTASPTSYAQTAIFPPRRADHPGSPRRSGRRDRA